MPEKSDTSTEGLSERVTRRNRTTDAGLPYPFPIVQIFRSMQNVVLLASGVLWVLHIVANYKSWPKLVTALSLLQLHDNNHMSTVPPTYLKHMI